MKSCLRRDWKAKSKHSKEWSWFVGVRVEFDATDFLQNFSWLGGGRLIIFQEKDRSSHPKVNSLHDRAHYTLGLRQQIMRRHPFRSVQKWLNQEWCSWDPTRDEREWMRKRLGEKFLSTHKLVWRRGARHWRWTVDGHYFSWRKRRRDGGLKSSTFWVEFGF